MKNREKILLHATQLFNQKGLVNVRLQHISDESIISLGNIGYHFRNKEAIIAAIVDTWERRQREILIEYRHAPIFANLARLFGGMEDLQQEYRFLFVDLLEIQRSYPAVFQRIEPFFRWQELWFQEILRFNVARGAFHPQDEATAKDLPRLLVQQINAWPYTQEVWLREASEANLASWIWSLLTPYLTASGREELSVLRRQRISWSDEE